MEIITSIARMQEYSKEAHMRGLRVGFIPTMGALHAGHMSLLEISQSCADVHVMSIFVNPKQFGPSEDFNKYPRPLDNDCELAKAHGCDVIFSPSPAKMYPDSFLSEVSVGKITNSLCGKSRPGHFAGVCTIVLKLFNCVAPDSAIFGQKDAQQVIVVKRMVEDLNVDVKIIVAPTHREVNGLAMSSRNVYLTPAEKIAALSINKGLLKAQYAFKEGVISSESLVELVREEISSQSILTLEYIEAVATGTLQKSLQVNEPTLLACAVRTLQSKTRLIDNCVLGGNL